jgi:2-C-methyl-D-erythritol 4-phosphate cytidylyltransferase
MERTYAIIPAAGRGIRMGSGHPKQFLDLDGKPILIHTLATFCGVEQLAGILLVVPEPFQRDTRHLLHRYMGTEPAAGQGVPSSPDQGSWFRIESPIGAPPARTKAEKFVRLVAGGIERQDSVFNGLGQLPADCGWVVIHDGVRPFVSPDLIRKTCDLGMASGAAIAALPSTDTVKRVENGEVAETLPRESIWLVQTPQVFRRELILRAYDEALRQGWIGTDDASLVERLGYPVAVALGERSNIKVTTPEDLEWGATFMKRLRVDGLDHCRAP